MRCASSYHRRVAALRESGGALFRKDALDPDESFGDVGVFGDRCGFIFEPPAEAADSAFCRFVAYRARFCALSLPSGFFLEEAAPWRREAWRLLVEQERCALVQTPERSSDEEGGASDETPPSYAEVGGSVPRPARETRPRRRAWYVVFRDERTRRRECPDETFWAHPPNPRAAADAAVAAEGPLLKGRFERDALKGTL
jgi:hypothetical protein